MYRNNWDNFRKNNWGMNFNSLSNGYSGYNHNNFNSFSNGYHGYNWNNNNNFNSFSNGYKF